MASYDHKDEIEPKEVGDNYYFTSIALERF